MVKNPKYLQLYQGVKSPSCIMQLERNYYCEPLGILLLKYPKKSSSHAFYWPIPGACTPEKTQPAHQAHEPLLSTLQLPGKYNENVSFSRDENSARVQTRKVAKLSPH